MTICANHSKLQYVVNVQIYDNEKLFHYGKMITVWHVFLPLLVSWLLFGLEKRKAAQDRERRELGRVNEAPPPTN